MDSKLSLEEMETEYWRKNAENVKVQEESLKLYKQFIDEKPDLFAQFICEAILGVASENNIFMQFSGDHEIPNNKGLVNSYSDLAAVILSKIDTSKLPAINGEFICLKDWITEEMSVFPPYSGNYKDSNHDRMAWTFFLAHEENFGNALLRAAELAYHGVPWYQCDDDGSYFPISSSHEDYIYLSQKGKYWDASTTGKFPEWAKKYYVRSEHLSVHDTFFRSLDVLNVDEVDLLRIALRNQIGMNAPPTKEPAIKRNSEDKSFTARERNTLLKIIAALCKAQELDLAKPYKAAETVKNSLELLGDNLSLETIVAKLGEAKKILIK